MLRYIKNNTGSTKTWVGQAIDSAAYFQIEATKLSDWANDSTLLTAVAAAEAIVSSTNDNSGHITDVNLAINYLKGAIGPTDSDGAPLTRAKITQSGWHFQIHNMDFTTSKLDGIYNKDASGNNLNFTTLKFYNNSGTQLTANTQAELDANCAKTVIDWEPTFDTELIGGSLYQAEAPSTDVRIWVVAIPDLPVAYGGSVPFVTGGVNLKLMDKGQVLDIDGKTPKLLPYSATYHTNKLRIIITHGVGVQHSLLMLYKLFRANT